MKKINFYLTTLGLSFLLSSCQTLRVNGPLAVHESPEILSQKPGNNAFNLRIEPVLSSVLADNVGARPLNPTTVKNEAILAQDLVIGMQIPMGSRWELGVNGSTYVWFFNGFTFSGRIMAKYQIWGEPYKEGLAQGHLVSLFGHLLGSQTELRGNQRCLFCEGGYPWSATGHYQGFNLGISYGYRWNDRFMTFLSLASQKYTQSGRIHQQTSATGDFPEATLNLESLRGENNSLGGGFYFGVRNQLQVQYSYTEVSRQDKNERIYAFMVSISSLNFSKKGEPIQPYN